MFVWTEEYFSILFFRLNNNIIVGNCVLLFRLSTFFSVYLLPCKGIWTQWIRPKYNIFFMKTSHPPFFREGVHVIFLYSSYISIWTGYPILFYSSQLFFKLSTLESLLYIFLYRSRSDAWRCSNKTLPLLTFVRYLGHIKCSLSSAGITIPQVSI